MADPIVREAVGIFHDEAALQTAVDELMIAGFDRSSLSLLAGQQTVESQLGHRFERVAEIEDDSAVPSQAFIGVDSRVEAKGAMIGGLAYVGAVASVGMIVASGGTMAAALIVAAVAGGGRRPGWGRSRAIHRSPPRASPAGAAGAGWSPPVGAHDRRRA